MAFHCTWPQVKLPHQVTINSDEGKKEALVSSPPWSLVFHLNIISTSSHPIPTSQFHGLAVSPVTPTDLAHLLTHILMPRPLNHSEDPF